jgi:hypothetical protein
MIPVEVELVIVNDGLKDRSGSDNAGIGALMSAPE